MTCKDCIHYRSCKNLLEAMGFTVDGDGKDADKRCDDFDNRSAWRKQKCGQWVDCMVRDWRCSECGEKINKVRNVDGYCYDDKPNYCPNCGAKMNLEDNQ